jgi:hypothetical protein
VAATRHSWARLKEHNYLCRKCGMVKVHVYDETLMTWTALWHLPDGTQDVRSRVAPCAPGEKTDGRLAIWRACGAPDVKKHRRNDGDNVDVSGLRE